MKGLKTLLIGVLLWFLGRGMCACARLDSRVAAEVSTWAEGAGLCIAIAPSGPAMAVERRGEASHGPCENLTSEIAVAVRNAAYPMQS